MLALKKTMILGIVVSLIVWIVLLSTGPVVGGASETWPPTPVSPANNAWTTENKTTFKWSFIDPNLTDSQSGFNLQISNATTGFVVRNITEKSSTQNYTLNTTEALDDGTYYWKVKTNDTSGAWSSWSIAWVVNIDTIPPPPVTEVSVRVLTGFEIRELEIGGQAINLSWTESDDPNFKRYEVYASTEEGVLGTQKATIDARATTYYDKIEIGPSGLDPGTTYWLSVVVVDQALQPSPAATVSLTTTAPLNWPLMGGIAVAVEVAIAAIFVVIKLFIKKE